MKVYSEINLRDFKFYLVSNLHPNSTIKTIRAIRFTLPPRRL